jgi:MSHA biogenesis protein MshK
VSRHVLIAALLWLPLAAGALDDPMRPPTAAAPGSRKAGPVEPGFALTSTTIARERRVAVINGKSVAQGDSVGGAEVVEILPTQVRLRQGEREMVVRLLPVSVKTPAKTEKQEQQ